MSPMALDTRDKAAAKRSVLYIPIAVCMSLLQLQQENDGREERRLSEVLRAQVECTGQVQSRGLPEEVKKVATAATSGKDQHQMLP